MLTHEQIKELAALASALQKITDREDKAAFNLRQRYAIERGELKAAASAEVRSLHRIDIEDDADVATWRQSVEEQATDGAVTVSPVVPGQDPEGDSAALENGPSDADSMPVRRARPRT